MSARYWVLRRRWLSADLMRKMGGAIYLETPRAISEYLYTDFFGATRFRSKVSARARLRTLRVFAVDYIAVRVDCTETPAPVLSHKADKPAKPKTRRRRLLH